MRIEIAKPVFQAPNPFKRFLMPTLAVVCNADVDEEFGRCLENVCGLVRFDRLIDLANLKQTPCFCRFLGSVRALGLGEDADLVVRPSQRGEGEDCKKGSKPHNLGRSLVDKRPLTRSRVTS